MSHTDTKTILNKIYSMVKNARGELSYIRSNDLQTHDEVLLQNSLDELEKVKEYISEQKDKLRGT